jgi:hypothetical protein
VLSHLVVVARFLDEEAGPDHCVDLGGGRVSGGEEGTAVDLANVFAFDLDDRVRADHLKIEDESVWPQSVSEAAQDVHDVLGLHSSERPGEDDDVVLRPRDLDLSRRPDPEGDELGELCRELRPRRRNRIAIWIEGEDARSLLGKARGEPPVATADFDHGCVLEAGKPAQRAEVSTVRIENRRQRL